MNFPGRSLIGAEYLPPEQDGDIRVLATCDCGTATDLTVQLGPVAAAEGAEAAFTCGCGTAYWFTVGGEVLADDPECE